MTDDVAARIAERRAEPEHPHRVALWKAAARTHADYVVERAEAKLDGAQQHREILRELHREQLAGAQEAINQAKADLAEAKKDRDLVDQDDDLAEAGVTRQYEVQARLEAGGV